MATVKKTTVKEEEVKEAKKTVVKKTVKAVEKDAVMSNAVQIAVVGIDGKEMETITLPSEIFGEKMNKPLLAQAVRVYLANQRQGNASTKTRGEVEGSTRKIYRQKGTGKARHGSLRAPIFVKGGIVFGPKPKDFGLSLPKKMKRKALFSALSAKVQDKEIIIVAGLEKMEAKTKLFVEMMKNVQVVEPRTKVLFVTSAHASSVLRSGRNVPGVSFAPGIALNAYAVLNTKKIVIMKDAIEEMKSHFLRKDK
jgi:large subunit ribosomal protein L4